MKIHYKRIGRRFACGEYVAAGGNMTTDRSKVECLACEFRLRGFGVEPSPEERRAAVNAVYAAERARTGVPRFGFPLTG